MISLSRISRRAFSSKSAKIGVIGLGNVGSAVVRNLVKSGYNVSVIMDVKTEAMRPFPEQIHRASTPADAAVRSEILVTALPMPSDVKAVMEGDQGVFKGLKPGSVWMDHSTTDYEQTVEFAGRVEQLEGQALEAPVTGGLALIKQGKMTAFVGGDRAAFDRCKDVLEQSCANVLYMGAIGTATVSKVISNMLAAAHNVVMGEALMMAKRSGVDLQSFFNGIRVSAGNSYVFETEAPLVFNGSFDPEFSIKLHCKDLNLGYRIAQKNKCPVPVHSLVEQIYNQARYKYGDDVGSSHPPKLLEDDLEESLQIPGFHDWTYTIQMVEGGSLGVVHSTKDKND